MNSKLLRKVHSEVLEDVWVEPQYYFHVGKATKGAYIELPLCFKRLLKFSLFIFTKKYIACLSLLFSYWWFFLYTQLNLGDSPSSHYDGYLREPCLKQVQHMVSFRSAVTTPQWSANSTIQKLAESENTGFSESQATLLLLARRVLNFVQWRMIMKEHNFSIQKVESTEDCVCHT